jgi:RNA recognition motif-containing protein
MMRLYVGNLPFDATTDDLLGIFARFGTVADALVAMDRATGRPHGYGYVDMASGGEAAVAAVNGATYRGRTLVAGEFGPPRVGRQLAGFAPAGPANGFAGHSRAGHSPPRKKASVRTVTTPPPEGRRREVFLALVEAQDGKASVPASRRAVAARFGLSEAVVRAIEAEGLAGGWPPL